MVAALREDFVDWKPLRKLCWDFVDSNEIIPLKLMPFQVSTYCLTHWAHMYLLNK